MKTIVVKIVRGEDGSYWCSTIDPINKATLHSSGDSVEEAKKDLIDELNMLKSHYAESGEKVPEVNFKYEYDIQSFFNYFSIFNATQLAKLAKINPSLMRQYICGNKAVSEKTAERINSCINRFTEELANSSLF